MNLSVIVVTYNRPSTCAETLVHLLKLMPTSSELLVVDQGPGWELETLCADLAKTSSQLHYVRLDSPHMTQARNVGIRNSTGEIVLFVDDDVIPGRDLFTAHLNAYTDSTVGGVGGKIIEEGATSPPANHQVTHPVFGWLFADFTSDQPTDILTARGCNMSFRRTALLATGGFDVALTRPFFFREDSDACFAVRKLGYRLRYIPEASLIHLAKPQGGTRAVAELPSAVQRELESYRLLFAHLRDDLYFQSKHLALRDRLHSYFLTYRMNVGLSRWPWRLAAKHLCFLAALIQANIMVARFRFFRAASPKLV